MIIGFDGSRAFQKNRTGTENYSYQLLKALARFDSSKTRRGKIDKKNSYIVYTRGESSVIARPRVLRGEAIFQNSRSPRRLSPPRDDDYGWPENFHFKQISWPRLWTQGGLAVQTFKDPLDVLFVPSHTLPLLRKPGLKTVLTVHDLGAEYLPSMHQLKQRLYLSLMQKYQLKTATKIIAVSEVTKQDLIKKIGIESEKISVVYEGYDREKFKVDVQRDVLNSFNLVPSSYFLFVGTVQPRKNLTKLIQSFYQLCHPEGVKRPKDLPNDSETSPEILHYVQNDNVKLVIAGSKGWLADEIYRLPKKLGIENRIKFLGYVADKDLPALYSGAIALVFPSLFEGFGLPILEAQACGCPVITSNISSMPEVAGRGAILVDPYSIDDIVKGMDRIKRKGERGKLIKAGLENVKRFSWEKAARETLRVLEETVDG